MAKYYLGKIASKVRFFPEALLGSRNGNLVCMSETEPFRLRAYESAKLKLDAHRALQKEARRQRELLYSANPKSCRQCSHPLNYSQFKEGGIFCSRRCGVLSSNRKREKVSQKTCFCGVALNRQGKYCSQACQQESQYRSYIERWNKNLETGGSWHSVAKPVRRWLGEQFGEQCSECGWNRRHPLTGRVPVQVDHIDGDSANNKPNNLRLLCPSCHSLTPTYGALNKGRGRKERYKPR